MTNAALEIRMQDGNELTDAAELRELVHYLIDMDAPDLALNSSFVDNLTEEHLTESGHNVEGLVDRVRDRLRVTPSPNGSLRYLIRSDFNEAFRAFHVRPDNPEVGDNFYEQLKVLIIKVLRDRNVYTQHWDELHSDLLIRCLAAAKKFKELAGTPYSYFYKVLYRRVITLHQRMMRGLSREFSYADDYFWDSLLSYEPNPEELLCCIEEIERRESEIRGSKTEMTRTLFCNLLGWSQKPSIERRKFLKCNLPAYFLLMRENKMSRGEVRSLVNSMFPPEEVAYADLNVKIEEFPLDAGAEEIRHLDDFVPKEFKAEIPEWAETALSLLTEKRRITEAALSSEVGVGRDRLRAELTRLCKIKGVMLRRDREGKDHVFSLGLEA